MNEALDAAREFCDTFLMRGELRPELGSVGNGGAFFLTGIEGMAARKASPQLTEQWRAKIQTSMLVNRLVRIANGKADCSPTQMKALEIALKKTLPDLSAVQHSGSDGGPMQVIVQRFSEEA